MGVALAGVIAVGIGSAVGGLVAVTVGDAATEADATERVTAGVTVGAAGVGPIEAQADKIKRVVISRSDDGALILYHLLLQLARWDTRVRKVGQGKATREIAFPPGLSGC